MTLQILQGFSKVCVLTSFRRFQHVGIVKIQDRNDFTEKVLNNKNTVLVDFFANWCGPCKVLTPILEKAVNESPKPVLLAKIDIDNFHDMAMEYEVEAVPTVIAMKMGKELKRFSGALDENKVKSFLDSIA